MVSFKNYTFGIYKYVTSAFSKHSMMLYFSDEINLHAKFTIQLIYQIIQ
jgi:hypothetical protein